MDPTAKFLLSVSLLLCTLSVESKPVQLGSILAPVVHSPAEEEVEKLNGVAVAAESARQPKIKYEWIQMHHILGRLEALISSQVAADDQVSLASRSHWEPVKIKVGSHWDLTLTNPFVPDARGRWFPSIELVIDGVQTLKRRLSVNVALYRELWQVDQPLKQGEFLDSTQLVHTKQDIYSLNFVGIERHESLEGYELVRAVNAGSLLKWSDLRKQPAVEEMLW